LIRAEETKVGERRSYVLDRALNEGYLIYITGRITGELSAGLRGGPVGQLPRVSTSKGRYDINRVIGNVVTSELRFPKVKEFYRNLSAIWTHALKKFCQPSPKPKEVYEV
jgi:hypothetical protein